MPFFAPIESVASERFTAFLEQLASERADQAHMAVRVLTTDSQHYSEIKNSIWVEDT